MPDTPCKTYLTALVLMSSFPAVCTFGEMHSHAAVSDQSGCSVAVHYMIGSARAIPIIPIRLFFV